MKLYLAGPMQGIPHFNFPLFNEIAARLRAVGHEVFNPAEKDIERHGGIDISKGNETGNIVQSVTDHEFSLRDALAEDLHYICQHADGIVLLPGWEQSNGAFAEWATARALAKVYDFTFIYILKQGDHHVVAGTPASEQADAP